MNQRQVSSCTINSYRDTFRLILRFLNTEEGLKSDKVTIETFTTETILGFINYLAKNRNNSNRTINNRLAAINSFMDYVSYECPEYSNITSRIKGIPYRSIEKKNVCYLTEAEINAILEVCDIQSFLGRRDKVIILLLYNTGIRVSELTSIKKSDLYLENLSAPTVHIIGKGRKERT